MKVKTDLKAGNLLDELNLEATQLTSILKQWFGDFFEQLVGFEKNFEDQISQFTSSLLSM